MTQDKRTEAVCSNCGEPAVRRVGEYRFAECGLKEVHLKGIDVIQCSACGNEDPVIPAVNQLMQVLAIAVTSKPNKLVGQEIKFLRKFLRLTGDEFASLLGTDKTTISKWERGDQDHGERADRLIRAVTMVLGDGLNEADMRRVVKRFPEIREDRRMTHYMIDPELQTCEYSY